MKKITLLLIVSCFGIFKINAQLIGQENLVTKQVYQGTFIVNGDKDKYYPVVFKRANQNRINHLKIYRSYGEAGPNELSATHRGGLLLEIDVNYGGWGGQAYDWKIANLRQIYHETFANAAHASHNTAFIVWLRGGGFQYHYESEYPTQLQVALSTSELIFNENPAYLVHAPAALDAPNKENINAHTINTNYESSSASFDLKGSSTKSLMHLKVNNESPSWKDQITVLGNLNTPYGIAFAGNGHHRGGLYTQNSSTDYSGDITLWARHQGKITLEGHDIILNNRNKVGIGTTTIPDDFKVAIAGNVITEEIKVQLKANWPDFVFNKDYNLPTLEEVEKHIKEKGHLKNIPSAKEVKENDGIELGEMNRKLLQKIEELTLYTIQQQKELQKQKEKNSTLEARLLKLEKLILK